MLLQILNSHRESLRTNSFLEMKKHTLIHLYILRLIVYFQFTGEVLLFQVLYLFDILKFLSEIKPQHFILTKT